MQCGDTPLHDAAHRGYTATAEVLLQAGADVKAADKVGSNGWVAIVSVVCPVALSAAFQYINVTKCPTWQRGTLQCQKVANQN